MVGNYHVGSILFYLFTAAGLYRPCRHRPEVECGPEGSEPMQYHQTPVKGFGQTPDDRGTSKKEDRGKGDEDDVKYRHGTLDHGRKYK